MALMIGTDEYGTPLPPDTVVIYHGGPHEKSPVCDSDPVCVPYAKCSCEGFLDPNCVAETHIDGIVRDPNRNDQFGANTSTGRIVRTHAEREADARAVNIRYDDGARMAPSTPAYRPPPGHYSTGAGIDPWAVWDAFDLDRYTANAVKYLLRAGKKDIAPRLEDLKKARDYVNKAIEREELRQ